MNNINNDKFKLRFWSNINKCMYSNIQTVHTIFIDIGDSILLKRNEGHLMQCSGLKDSNGKLIYEGDIVHLAGIGDEIEIWFPFINLYEAYPENSIGEIKGNIYENPEL